MENQRNVYKGNQATFGNWHVWAALDGKRYMRELGKLNERRAAEVKVNHNAGVKRHSGKVYGKEKYKD